MATWRVARSLDVMLAQINTAYPGRSKRSDGSIGDISHSSRASDHNPDPGGVVRARDFTHDPGEFDAHAFADRLLAEQDGRLKYVISNGRIGSGPSGVRPGVWRPYYGVNKHAAHCHVSVISGASADYTHPWAGVTSGVFGSRIPDLSSDPTAPHQEEDDMTPEQQKTLDQIAWTLGQMKPQTDRLHAVQAAVDATAWGVLDPDHGARAMLARALGRTVDDIDETALATQLAPLLAAALPRLTDDYFKSIAKAVNDEAHRRSAE